MPFKQSIVHRPLSIVHCLLSHMAFTLLAIWLPLSLSAQQPKKSYKIACIGFYNFENLFDTHNDPHISDEEFTPEGANKYTDEIYKEKLSHLDQVVSELGVDMTADGVAVLGVAEIENRKVLEDFVQQPKVKNRNYQIVHFNSPDPRGIDVALLYQPKYFQPTNQKALPLKIYGSNGDPRLTRDVLLVSGLFGGETMHFLVNHWPSRSGGEALSQPYRNAAALLCKQVCDSLTTLDPKAKIVIMGDLNDDPTSPSVQKVLQAQAKAGKTPARGLFNPMYALFKKGMGTLAYQDAWSLFDQIILSKGLVDASDSGYRYFKAIVHNPAYLVQKSGHFQGYPFRTFAGNTYLGGYSDHFPVYIYLVKPTE